jgi:hypothetical protein
LAAREHEEVLQRQEELGRLNNVSDDAGLDSISDSEVDAHLSVFCYEWHEDGSSPPESRHICLDESDGLSDYSPTTTTISTSVTMTTMTTAISNNGESNSGAELEPDFKLDVGETLGPTANVEQEIYRILKQERSPTHSLESNRTDSRQDTKPKVSLNHGVSNITPYTLWACEMQLVRFRETAEKVAKDILKAKSIKPTKRRGKNTAASDFGANSQGKEDSKKIDVRQNLVE